MIKNRQAFLEFPAVRAIEEKTQKATIQRNHPCKCCYVRAPRHTMLLLSVVRANAALGKARRP